MSPTQIQDTDDISKKYREAVKAEKAKHLDFQEGVRHIMSHSQARLFLWWIMEECGLRHTTLHENPQHMGYYTGKKEFAEKVEALLMEIAPRLYIEMLQERFKEYELSDATDESV